MLWNWQILLHKLSARLLNFKQEWNYIIVEILVAVAETITSARRTNDRQ